MLYFDVLLNVRAARLVSELDVEDDHNNDCEVQQDLNQGVALIEVITLCVLHGWWVWGSAEAHLGTVLDVATAKSTYINTQISQQHPNPQRTIIYIL